MKTQKLTITLPHEKGHIPAQSLVTALQDTIRLLQELQRAKGVKDAEIQEWNIISVEMHSPLTLTMAPAKRGPSVTRQFMTGMKTIQRVPQRPRGFNDTALALARKLSTVVSNGGGPLRFSFGRQSVSLTRKAFQNLEAIQSRHCGFSATMELEGRLETVSVHGEEYFCIYDPLTGEPIRCSFDKSISLVKISELLTRHARVRVNGLVRYNKASVPVQVRVANYTELLEQKDLPQIKDVHEAGVNIAQDVDSVEYIRKIRNGK